MVPSGVTVLAGAACPGMGWMRGRPRPRLTDMTEALSADMDAGGAAFLTVACLGTSGTFEVGFGAALGTGMAFCLGAATFVFDVGIAAALVLAACFALFFPDDGFLETAIGAGSCLGGMTSLRQTLTKDIEYQNVVPLVNWFFDSFSVLRKWSMA